MWLGSWDDLGAACQGRQQVFAGNWDLKYLPKSCLSAIWLFNPVFRKWTLEIAILFDWRKKEKHLIFEDFQGQYAFDVSTSQISEQLSNQRESLFDLHSLEKEVWLIPEWHSVSKTTMKKKGQSDYS